MAKTLVTAKHGTESQKNGFGGCHTRWAHDGLCSGVVTAEWLNGLGDDEAPFGTLKGVTNGEVRRNWLAGSGHIVALDEALSDLRGQVERTRREYTRAKRRLMAEEHFRRQAEKKLADAATTRIQ